MLLAQLSSGGPILVASDTCDHPRGLVRAAHAVMLRVAPSGASRAVAKTAIRGGLRSRTTDIERHEELIRAHIMT